METIVINDQKFQERIEQLVDALGKDPQVVLADEARLFLKQAINLTPPKSKAQGEQAIRDDLNRTFTAANDDFLIYEADGGFKSNLDKWFTNAKGERVHMQFDAVDVQGRGMRRYHQSQRNARGRTVGRGNRGSKTGSLWKARYVVGYAALAEYTAKVLQRVGIRKSGWLRAYYEVGGKLPSWIQRQAQRGMGRVQNNLNVKGHPSIVMASHAPGVMDDERILRDTFRARGEAIAKRIKLFLSGYSEDVKSGIKIRTHAKRMVD